MSSAKTTYRLAIDSGLWVPLFARPWWLDCLVGSDGWDVVLIEKNGAVVASWPFTVRTRFNQNFLGQPPMSAHLGPWIQPSKHRSGPKFSKTKKTIDELIQQLPKYADFRQSFHPASGNWLPYYWQGFNQSTGYTYQTDLRPDIDTLRAQLDSGTRGQIKRSIEKYGNTVEFGGTADQFYQLHAQVFSRQDRSPPLSKNLLFRLIDAIYEQSAGTIALCRDKDGESIAAALLVESGDTVFYLASGSNDIGRKTGGLTHALWESLIRYKQICSVFDYEGSMVEPIESYFRSFGGVQIPYHNINRTPSRVLTVIRALRAQ